ncbi:MAG: type II secretion system F family protein [Pararhodobacter sp.]|nr:type II secretion system F family protein [Pararhodobacter sp.]
MLETILETTAWQLAVALLGGLAIALLLLLVLNVRAGPREQLRERARRMGSVPPGQRVQDAAAAGSGADDDSGEGRQGGTTTARASLREVRHGQLQQKSGMLRQRAGKYGVNLRYVAMALGGGVAVTIALIVAGADLFGAVVLGVVAGVGLPLYIVIRSRARWLAAIEREFPTAIDIMVRGLRAGLPLPECMQLVAREADPALAREFRHMVNEVEIGLPVPEAMQRMARRLQIPEIQLFATIIAIQSATGGSLAKVLDAVSSTVRSRHTLRQKVVIMSNEARASAAIIGALPIVLGAVLFIVSPDYISLMFTTVTGRWMLAGAVLWMLVGVQVMRKMIDFDV